MCKSSTNYLELISLSTKGDKQALEALLAYAEKLSSKSKHEEAAKAFKDSAISYRISASRNLSRAIEANSKVNQLNQKINILKQLLDTDLSNLKTLPRKLEGLSKKFIWETLEYDIENEIIKDEYLESLTSLLNSTLNEANETEKVLGTDDHYAGATLPSTLTHLMEDYFGLGDSTFAFELKNNRVRLLADLLAAEIEKRFLASKEV